ncbi:MAG: hypothetical protein GQ570_01515 [Helicobacteraceae bacterium]|nr:hypothetical protein [Helicobacteraceae bacterium]
MINDIIKKVELHKKRAKAALNEIQTWTTLDCEIFENFEKVKTVDSFIYRFIKLQDIMGEKLFKTFLDEIGEYKDDMSLLDILDKLEKFNILDNPIRWMEYRKLRNKLTHEYPNNEEDVIEGIALAIEVFNEIEIIFNNIIKYKNNISIN